jgi:Ni/Co efflux regulator RcnB
MNKLMITVAAVALLAGETAASAQTGYTNGGSWRRNTVGSQGSQDQGSQTQVAQNTRRDRTGGRTQTQTPAQTQGAPDWAAYYRNNKDLQRVYEGNKAVYEANGESPTAFAERHYREHGQAEGRALPRMAATAQPTQQRTQPSRQQGGAYTGQYNEGAGRFTPRDDRPSQRQDRRSQSDQRRYNDDSRRGDQGRDFSRRADQGPNRNWQDWSRRYGDQNRTFRRQGGYAWDGRNWRPEQFNRRTYNHNRFAERRYRISPFYWPRGWSYQRLTFGQYLPFALFSQNYWIDSYWTYNLPIPPYGCEWVRYGDDALLVDVETGEILQVVYNIFY